MQKHDVPSSVAYSQIMPTKDVIVRASPPLKSPQLENPTAVVA